MHYRTREKATQSALFSAIARKPNYRVVQSPNSRGPITLPGRYHGLMPNVGPFELAIVLIIALVVFGPKRLPELGRSLGKGIREFRGSVSGESHDEPERQDAIEPPKQAAEQDAEGEPVAHDRR
jgi:sec-independent protein translocase protein TatA